MKDNNKILILIGVPASGKSKWALNYVRTNDNYIRVSRDDFRYMLKNSGVCEPKIESMVTDLVNESITQALFRKMNVLLDNTNLKETHIREVISNFKYSADIDFRVFDISLDKAIERDSTRDKSVGKLVLTKMYNDYKVLMDSFDFQPSRKEERAHLIPNFNSSKKDAVIFDIDGTIALMSRRGPFDWSKVYRDDLNDIVSEHIGFHKSKNREVILVTGRDEICRGITQDWLELHEIKYDKLYMRTKDDYRKDTIIKTEIYKTKIESENNVLCAYDDRLSVVKAWNDLGVYVFTVNQGLHQF